MPENAELTAVQAAGVLNVSRLFPIKLPDEGAIPQRKIGKHQRIRMEGAMACKAVADLFRRRRTADIHREWIEAPERARDLMDRAARDGLVEGDLP